MKFRKSLLSLLFASCVSVSLLADEGMWLPNLLEGMTITDMKARGFKLNAEDVYSVNNTSMKDAVCQFAGGCTAELISAKGLLLTNHHCGFGAIQALSTTENNYLENGFWAMNQSEEKPCPGVTAMFIISMQEVTNDVLAVVTSSMNEADRNNAIQKKMAEMEAANSKGTTKALVRAFYYGNQFYMFMTETFTDVRLVGAPPKSLGNFGADTDNWVWPRHTADFSMFRIYAGADNKPAAYSPSNVPFVPKKSFTINARGVNMGDFTMVYGFPGRTTEYLSSYGVDLAANVMDPVRVQLRTIRLEIMAEEMAKNPAVKLQYASKRNGAANAWKKWQGEMLGLNSNDAVGKKQAQEAEFTKRIAADQTLTQKYGTILPDLKQTYAEIAPWQEAGDYMNEGALSIELVRYASNFRKLIELSKSEKKDQKEIDATVKALTDGAPGYFKDYHLTTDKRIAIAVCKDMEKGMAADKRPAVFNEVKTNYKGSWEKYFGKIYSTSIFAKQEKVLEALKNYDATKWQTIGNDPGYLLMEGLYDHFNKNIMPTFTKLNNELNRLNRIYMEAQMAVFKEKRFYPDANSTLRVTYGVIAPYQDRSAKDGYMYNWYTTLDGLIAKDSKVIEDYQVPQRMKDIYAAKDFGRYADKKDGKVHTCFIAMNHTTGGNSGSPVIDAEGNLIGTNFDRVWEGTMSDIYYDPNLCRNITLDVRYTLFIIDKYGGAGYLLNEMNILW